jgi:hypothetical protein
LDLMAPALLHWVPPRLAAPSGAPLVAQQLMRLKLNSIWAVMVALQEPLEAPNGLEGAQAGPPPGWALHCQLHLIQPARSAV